MAQNEQFMEHIRSAWRFGVIESSGAFLGAEHRENTNRFELLLAAVQAPEMTADLRRITCLTAPSEQPWAP
jgi:hypothetical protein